MLFARLRGALLTLRFRLALWITILVGLVVGLGLWSVGQLVRRSLVNDFDTILRKDLADMRQMLRKIDFDPAKFDELHDWIKENEQVSFLQLFDADGHVIFSSSETLALSSLPAVATHIEDAEFRDYKKLRYVEDRLRTTGWLVRIGLSREGLLEDLALLNRILLLAGAVILILTPLAGVFVAGRATRPLQWIISTTARLQPQHLDERLPVRGTHDELDQLSITINGMLDRIADYLQRQREFVANAAHELRSPLTAVRSMVEVTLNRPRSEEEYTELLGQVMDECARLSLLINRLLFLAEADAGQIAATTAVTRLDKLVLESIDMFQGVAEVQGVGLSVGRLPPVAVRGEEHHLRRLVRNLVDNALKYTPAPGNVRVELEAPADKPVAILRVSDEGIGIPRELVPRIFDRFFRVDGSRQRQDGKGGVGLGLSICDTIVTSLGGKIQVMSEQGKGSIFTVNLPLASGPTPAS